MTRLTAINRERLGALAPHLLPPEETAPVAGAINLGALNARRRAAFAVAAGSAQQVAAEPARLSGPIGVDSPVSINWLMNEDNHG